MPTDASIDVQDEKEIVRIVQTLAQCRDKAKKDLFAKGLPAYVIRGQYLVRLLPNGKSEIVKKIG